MNHADNLKKFGNAYVDLIKGFNEDIGSISDHKHRIDKQQDLDIIIHFVYRASIIIHDLNEWLTAFGVNGNADENKRSD